MNHQKILYSPVLSFLCGLYFSFFISLPSFANESVQEVFKRFETTFYNPINFGLKDLVVDIKQDDLVSQLNEHGSIGKVNDVFFKYYWNISGKKNIDIFGLPSGFQEIKNSLIELIATKMDYVIPQRLEENFKNLELKVTKQNAQETVVQAKDPLQMRHYQEVVLTFNQEGLVKKMQAISPLGTDDVTFTYQKRPWSENKWVLEEVVVQTNHGVQQVKVVHQISYNKIAGFGLPEKIVSVTTQNFYDGIDGKNKKLAYKREINSVLTFNQYKINTNEANKYFQRMKK